MSASQFCCFSFVKQFQPAATAAVLPYTPVSIHLFHVRTECPRKDIEDDRIIQTVTIVLVRYVIDLLV